MTYTNKRDMFDLHTIEEVEAMHDSTIIGGLKKSEWLRRAALPLRPLNRNEIPLVEWDLMHKVDETLVREEDGELFRRNPRTGRLQSGNGKLNGKGDILWDYA